MRAMGHFAAKLGQISDRTRLAQVNVELFGSLGATGRGHGTGPAVLAGLAGETPETIDPQRLRSEFSVDCEPIIARVAGRHVRVCIGFRSAALQGTEYSNTVRVNATDRCGQVLHQASYASIGGGSVLDEWGQAVGWTPASGHPHPFVTGRDLLQTCHDTGLTIDAVVLANERAWRSEGETVAALDAISAAMHDSIARGTTTVGVLPGSLHVERRAASLVTKIASGPCFPADLASLDWVTAWAIAVNEENAAGNRVVTAPTNGAAGIVPAVLEYYKRLVPRSCPDGVHRFLLTAAAIGSIVKENASVSGADVGCQGEIGAACAMAAAGLTAVLGGSAPQVENAAEIAIEHNLGLTCDPVGGLVQIPCIERNAVGAVKAITAARLALAGDGRHRVSLDQAIATLRDTGADMHHKYKETSLGGLAVHVVEC